MARIIVITGPSGVGKKEIIADLLSTFANLKFIPTLTTRKSKDLKDNMYEFVSEDDFFSLVETNSFLEYKTISGHRYGTLIRELDQTITSNNSFGIISVDIDGSISMKTMYGDDAIIIFVAPLSTEQLQEDLRSRQMSAHEIYNRINSYETKKHQMHEADFAIVNVSKANTVKLIGQIINNLR